MMNNYVMPTPATHDAMRTEYAQQREREHLAKRIRTWQAVQAKCLVELPQKMLVSQLRDDGMFEVSWTVPTGLKFFGTYLRGENGTAFYAMEMPALKILLAENGWVLHELVLVDEMYTEPGVFYCLVSLKLVYAPA